MEQGELPLRGFLAHESVGFEHGRIGVVDDDDAPGKWQVRNTISDLADGVQIRFSPNLWDEYLADGDYMECGKVTK